MKRTTVSARALVLAPLGRDAIIASDMLREAGIEADPCASLPDLIEQLDCGAAFVVITEEAIASADLQPLSEWIDDQQEWSDLPFILLTSRGGGLERNPTAARQLELLGNVTFLERPFHPTTLVSIARSALRARRRQYEARARLIALHESEIRFRTLFETMDEGFCIIEFLDGSEGPLSDYVHVQANPAYERHAGIPNVVGQKVREMVPDEAEGWVALYREVLLTGEPIRFERKLEATERYLELAAFRIEPASRNEVAVLFQDVTERRQAELALRESEGRLRFMSELEEALRGSGDAPTAMLAAAELLLQQLGVSRCAYADVDDDSNRFLIRDDARAPGIPTSAGTYSLDLFGPRAAADMRSGETLVVRDVGQELAPDEGRDMFQSIGINAIVCCPLVRDGRLLAMMAVHQDTPRDWQPDDISLMQASAERCWSHVERVSAEARLRESEAKFHAITNSVDQMIWSALPDGHHDYFNQRWYDFTGVPHGAAVGDSWTGFVHPRDRDEAIARWRRSLETGEPYETEFRLRDRSGNWRSVLSRAQCVRDGTGQITRWFGTSTDIQEIVEAREILTRSREQLEAAVVEQTRERNRVWEMSRDLFAIMGFDGYLKAINPAWEETLGRDHRTLMAMPFGEQVHPDDHQAVEQVMEKLLAGKSVERFEDRLLHADGSWRSISWTLVPGGDQFYAVGRDVTEERRASRELETAQEALRQAQKMEAMGQLTGGVAHDFNNLLTPIVGSLDLLQRRGLGGEREQRLIDGALQSAERAKTLVQRLLAFARRQPLQPRPVDIGQLIEGMADLLSSTTGPQVRVVVDVAPDLPSANADPNQLEMALLNLGVNARDAMPEGGTLRISAIQERVTETGGDLPAGDFVRLSVADTGTGMDEATLARAVEPFFSTKGIGKGTGLGLSMAHGLAAQLGGTLRIKSQPGIGTNIELWLPVSAAEASAVVDRPQLAEVDGKKRIALLVDDEEIVRASTADMLSDLGYRVQEAENAETALALIRDGSRPDVLVSDHLMPGMTGADLIRAARELMPGLPALIVSGYAEADGLAPDLPRLTKPFRRHDLAAKLGQVDQAAAS